MCLSQDACRDERSNKKSRPFGPALGELRGEGGRRWCGTSAFHGGRFLCDSLCRRATPRKLAVESHEFFRELLERLIEGRVAQRRTKFRMRERPASPLRSG